MVPSNHLYGNAGTLTLAHGCDGRRAVGAFRDDFEFGMLADGISLIGAQ